jgi:CheY-like chemotaxis protein
VIEDEHDVRTGIIKALEYEGYNTFGAQDGQLGIELARKHLPDLIICDIMMPERSGYSVLVELRRDPRTAMIPFIFLTAMTAREDFQDGIQLGADAYLTKPFDIGRLLAIVNSLILKKETNLSKQLDSLRVNLARTLPLKLQAPLTGILGFSGLLAESGIALLPQPADMFEMQAYIYENALYLQRSISNYLLYYELKLLHYEPERKSAWQQQNPVATKDLIACSASQKAQEYQRQNDLELTLIDMNICVPEQSLQKIAEELLDNAFRFSQPGTPVQIITDKEDQLFRLRITDHGCGMTPECLANLEEISGLGLKVCDLLVQLYGSKLTIESEPNQGTTVIVAFKQHA